MTLHAPTPHDSARLHVTGQAAYVDDLPLPAGALHLAFGLSPVAHGEIEALDLEAVRAAPGVALVLTAADLLHANDVSPSAHDEPLLAEEVVHYLGQPVFLVAASSHHAARRAARLGRIDIAPRPAILTIDQALAAGARFEDGPRVWSRGDAAAAIRAAPHVIEGEIEIGGQEHFYLEGQAALALPGEDGEMHVISSTQHPTEIQHKVAEALGAAMHRVRVTCRRMGGGFGGKESQGNALAVACALAAAATGRACKMRYDRDDDMTITGKRHDFRIRYRIGAGPDGRIRGVEFVHHARCGWSMDLSLPVADRAMLHADNAYHLPNVRIESHRLRTNTQSATAFRGFGGPQGMLGIERAMDHLAHDLGLDRVAVRRANYYAAMEEAEAPEGAPIDHAGDDGDAHADLASRGAAAHVDETAAALPPALHEAVADPASAPVEPGRAVPPGRLTPYGMAVEDFVLHEMTDRLLRDCDYHARARAIADWNAGSPILKRGIAFSPVKFGISFTLTHLNQAGALVHVYQDGSIALNHGGTEMGQGLHAKVAQVAAAAFGVPLARVRITATDTARVPNTSATAASSGTDLNGMAVRQACDEVRTRIEMLLAERYQTTAIRFADDHVEVGAERLTFPAAVRLAYENRVSLSAAGFYKTPKVEWDRLAGRGRPFFYFAYGCAVTEVAIDTLTGENRILRADILHDCGASLNPALDIGQIEGGYVQGAGWLTCEELVWDETGRLRTHAPSTYKIPACSDRPGVFNVALWEGRNREDTVGRSKAVGEPPLMLGISALLALSDAAAACGPQYPDLSAPATPERVLAAVARARGGQARGGRAREDGA